MRNVKSEFAKYEKEICHTIRKINRVWKWFIIIIIIIIIIKVWHSKMVFFSANPIRFLAKSNVGYYYLLDTSLW